MFEGNKEAKILFVSDFLRTKEAIEKSILSGERRDILINALNSAGVVSSDYAFTIIHPTSANGNKISSFNKEQKIYAQIACKELINQSKANVIVPIGEYALKYITGIEEIKKYHLSILTSKAEFGSRKVVPLLHMETIQRSYSDVAYIRFGATRLKEEMSSTLLNIPARKFHLSLDCTFDFQVDYLENIIKNATEVSTDVETGNGCVNTVGIAISPYEAIVIESTPQGKTPAQFHKLWDLYRKIWQSESIGKIAQNGLFESTWASVYGIKFNNLSFDTMWAMKFLHPTLERGLDNVGRIYTRYPYWKDDHSDFNNIRNWRSHLEYCGKDCTGQFAAKESMAKALQARGLEKPFFNLIMKQFPIANEMMSRGFRLDKETLESMKLSAQRDIESVTQSFDEECIERIGNKINVNSPKQVKEALKAIGIKIPTAKKKETTSRTALMKLKNKHPKETIIRDILKIDQLNKKSDEYLNFKCDDDGRIRFSMDLSSDENGIWIGKKTIFDKGFDATKVPAIVKNCIIADDGKTFVQIKINQPELRFISIDAPEYKLMDMLNKHKDISKYIASKIFNKNEWLINKIEASIAAQVIKSANELDSPKQFIEKCFAKTNIFYQEFEVKRMMQIVFEEFPGLRSRIERIKKEIYNKRSLQSNTRQITYYDRINDSMFRRALSFGPESSSNDLITNVCISLSENENVEFITRNKNSVLVQIDDDKIEEVLCMDFDGSIMEFSIGKRWGKLESV